MFQTLPKVYAYSRVFQLVLDHGSKSKVAKTRQLSLDELGGILKRSGSPPTGGSRIAHPASARSRSPGPSQLSKPASHTPGPTPPPSRGKSMLPSRLAPPRSRAGTLRSTLVPSTDPTATHSNPNGT